MGVDGTGVGSWTTDVVWLDTARTTGAGSSADEPSSTGLLGAGSSGSNGPRSTVLSGDPAALEEVHDRLREILGELGEPGRPGRSGRPGEQGEQGELGRR